MDFSETEEEDHFSFPVATTRNSPPHFIDSPPLWWHPIPPTFPHKNPENSKCNEVANEEKCLNKYSFQDFKALSTNKQRKFSSSYQDIGQDEKMDLLWEDLNEELVSGNTAKTSAASSPGREVKMICVEGLKLPKTRQDMMLSERRLGILMLFKFFKKVFTAHYSRNSVTKPHCI